MSTTEERLIGRQELAKQLGNVHQETIRAWLKSKKLPAPDVALSRKTILWKLTTLKSAGIHVV